MFDFSNIRSKYQRSHYTRDQYDRRESTYCLIRLRLYIEPHSDRLGRKYMDTAHDIHLRIGRNKSVLLSQSNNERVSYGDMINHRSRERSRILRVVMSHLIYRSKRSRSIDDNHTTMKRHADRMIKSRIHRARAQRNWFPGDDRLRIYRDTGAGFLIWK